jgi:hypothetical protein
VAVSPNNTRYGPKMAAACQKEVFHSLGDDVGGFMLGDEVGPGTAHLQHTQTQAARG